MCKVRQYGGVFCTTGLTKRKRLLDNNMRGDMLFPGKGLLGRNGKGENELGQKDMELLTMELYMELWKFIQIMPVHAA